MNPDYVLHPEALDDLADLWEFIAKDNPDAADRVCEEIYDAVRFLVPVSAILAPILRRSLCVFGGSMSI